MRSSTDSNTRSMVNVLEEQVLKEARRQIAQMPESQQQNLCPVDVAAYVLNRMEPMYATNRDGWGFQREKALRRVSRDITHQVKRAVQKMINSPARPSKPLPETVEARNALNQIRMQLKRPDLTWNDLPGVVADLSNTARLAQVRADSHAARSDSSWY